MEDMIKDKNGRILFLSPEKFCDIIIQKKSCFICGVNPKEAAFSKEHIFPDWILRDFNMNDAAIDLPNKEKHRYGTYVIPCCINCNNRMGSEIEKPLSEVLKAGHSSVVEYLEKNGPWSLYNWLARIFLKTHIKDRDLREFVDFRRGSNRIGENYRWEGLYHTFCLSRAFYAGTTFHDSVMGSFIVYPIADKVNDLSDRFFYVDDTNARVLILQLRDVGLIAAFNDFGIAMWSLQKMFTKIGKRRINASQLAELAAHVANCSSLYTNRPQIFYNAENNFFSAVPPEETLTKNITDDEWGTTMYHFTHKLIGKDDHDLERGIRAGTRTFLWDKDNNFNATDLP